MKTASISLIGMALVSTASAALRGTPANDAAPSTVQEQRAHMAVPPVVVGGGGGVTAESKQRGRSLQRPDQACYSSGNAVACSQIGSCDNAPACAATQQDAVNLGELFCPNNFMVWNNEEPDCAWQYMCCN